MNNNKTAEVVETSSEEIVASQPTIDYKAEFEKQQAEYQKLKSALDKTNSENADYKRKERERMSDDEKRQLAEAEKADYITKLERTNRKYELEKTMLGKGFSEAETANLIEKADNPKAMIELMAEIMNNRLDVNAKQVKAQTLKTNTQLPDAPTGTGFLTRKDELIAAKAEALKSNNLALFSKYERELAGLNQNK